MNPLQAILETLFECSALCVESLNRDRLVVHGDLGDVVAHILKNTTDANRADLILAVAWMEPKPDGTVLFPYVKYVQS